MAEVFLTGISVLAPNSPTLYAPLGAPAHKYFLWPGPGLGTGSSRNFHFELPARLIICTRPPPNATESPICTSGCFRRHARCRFAPPEIPNDRNCPSFEPCLRHLALPC